MHRRRSPCFGNSCADNAPSKKMFVPQPENGGEPARLASAFNSSVACKQADMRLYRPAGPVDLLAKSVDCGR